MKRWFVRGSFALLCGVCSWIGAIFGQGTGQQQLMSTGNCSAWPCQGTAAGYNDSDKVPPTATDFTDCVLSTNSIDVCQKDNTNACNPYFSCNATPPTYHRCRGKTAAMQDCWVVYCACK